MDTNPSILQPSAGSLLSSAPAPAPAAPAERRRSFTDPLAARRGCGELTIRRRYQRGDIEIVEPSEGERRVLIPVREIERLERERRERKPARRTKGSAVPQAAQAPDNKTAAAGGD
jgi:hypothetical protein